MARRFYHTFALLTSLALALVGCRPSPVSTTAASAAQVIQNKGSDTLMNLALAWAEAYVARNPQARIAVTGGGSGTGIAALINGTADLANVSREMKPEEMAEARRHGVDPMQHVVAWDAIAVVVHPSNPVDGLTLSQLTDIYTGRVTNWRQVGGQDRPIVLLSRETNSGTHVYFLEHVIQSVAGKEAIFAADTLLLPSSEGITAETTQNPNAIGYDGLGYVTPEQKTVKVARTAAGPYLAASKETVKAGTYPIARPLYMITNGQPTGLLKEYLDWILGEEGQSIVAELGFVPLR